MTKTVRTYSLFRSKIVALVVKNGRLVSILTNSKGFFDFAIAVFIFINTFAFC